MNKNRFNSIINKVSLAQQGISPTEPVNPKDLDTTHAPSTVMVSALGGGWPEDDPHWNFSDAFIQEGQEYHLMVRATNNGESILHTTIVPISEDGNCYPNENCSFIDNDDYLYRMDGDKGWREVPPNFSPTFSFTQEPGRSDIKSMYFKLKEDQVSPEGVPPSPGTEFFRLNIFSYHEDSTEQVRYLGSPPAASDLGGSIGWAAIFVADA
mgnify:CR=1 FL=1